MTYADIKRVYDHYCAQYKKCKDCPLSTSEQCIVVFAYNYGCQRSFDAALDLVNSLKGGEGDGQDNT